MPGPAGADAAAPPTAPSASRTSRASPDDPNDIAGPAGAGPGHYLAEDATLDYTINFENKATASLPARTVTITHVLDDDADLSTFQLGSMGYGDHLVTAPAGARAGRRRSRPPTTPSSRSTPAWRRDRTATWTFTRSTPRPATSPPTPLAGFLAGRCAGGYATYSVKPLPASGRVNAQARIVFDANAPLDTNVYATRST